MLWKGLRSIIAGLVLLSAGSVMARGGQIGEGYKGYPRGNALITVHELKRLIDAKTSKLVVIAAANDLEYRTGHIPGAYQLDRKDYEAAPESEGGVSGNLIQAKGFTEIAGRLGIDRDSTVVVYDTKYDATRLWWAFYYYGKKDVRVLDGGVKAWKEAGYPVSVLAPDLPGRSGTFTAKVAAPRLRVDTAEIVKLEHSKKAQLWDTRELKEFTGDELKKGAYRSGRIPWSRHSDWNLFKKQDNKAEWISAAELRPLLDELGYDPKKEHYFYCQSGVRSTQVLFALYLAGWPVEKLHNYDSSWIGWSKDAVLPLVTGLPSVGTLAQRNR